MDGDSAPGADSITITVGDLPPPPVGVSMYVAEIAMGMKGPHLDTIVTVRADTDEDGNAEAADSPVAGVVPQVALCPEVGSCFFTTTTAATDSGGQVKYKLLKPPAGNYTMTVIFVTDGTGSFEYHPELIAGDVTENSFDVP